MSSGCKIKDSTKADLGSARGRGPAFLWKKGNRSSKTAFWLFTVMAITVGIMLMVAGRIAFLSDELFVQALPVTSAFFSFVSGTAAMLYHKGKQA